MELTLKRMIGRKFDANTMIMLTKMKDITIQRMIGRKFDANANIVLTKMKEIDILHGRVQAQTQT